MTPELSNSGLPLSVVGELVQLYAAAMDRMAAMVRHPWGRTEASKLWKQARAAQLSLQVDAVLTGLGHNTARWVETHLLQAFADGIARGQAQARAVGVDVPAITPAGSFGLIDHRAVAVIARDTVADLVGDGRRQGSAGAGADLAKRVLRASAQHDLSEADINRVIAKGVIDGTPAAAVRDLRDQFRAAGAGRVVAGGREFDASYYASMVVRTKTREATVVARHGRLADLGLDLVAIVGRISVHFCTAYLGQVYSLSGRSGTYPAYRELPGGGPPFHPNCSKSTRPFVEGLASDRQLDAAQGDDDQPKMLGIDPAEAQRRFKALQLQQQVRKNYATTARELFGAAH